MSLFFELAILAIYQLIKTQCAGYYKYGDPIPIEISNHPWDCKNSTDDAFEMYYLQNVPMKLICNSGKGRAGKDDFHRSYPYNISISNYTFQDELGYAYGPCNECCTCYVEYVHRHFEVIYDDHQITAVHFKLIQIDEDSDRSKINFTYSVSFIPAQSRKKNATSNAIIKHYFDLNLTNFIMNDKSLVKPSCPLPFWRILPYHRSCTFNDEDVVVIMKFDHKYSTLYSLYNKSLAIYHEHYKTNVDKHDGYVNHSIYTILTDFYSNIGKTPNDLRSSLNNLIWIPDVINLRIQDVICVKYGNKISFAFRFDDESKEYLRRNIHMFEKGLIRGYDGCHRQFVQHYTFNRASHSTCLIPKIYDHVIFITETYPIDLHFTEEIIQNAIAFVNHLNAAIVSDKYWIEFTNDSKQDIDIMLFNSFGYRYPYQLEQITSTTSEPIANYVEVFPNDYPSIILSEHEHVFTWQYRATLLIIWSTMVIVTMLLMRFRNVVQRMKLL